MRVVLEWIKEFSATEQSTNAIAAALTMGGIEVERIEKTPAGTVLELGITPNRGDCLSMIGVAREVSALTQSKFSLPKVKPLKSSLKIKDLVKVKVEEKAACSRYGARVISGVKVGRSTKWVSDRLDACKIRSINNVVDATNLVLLETGHPVHAFDLKKIAGAQIIVKNATKNQKFTTLDGVSRLLEDCDLLICDANNPVALAGVMGGQNSEVDDSTTDLLLECAYFDPATVRRTSRRLGLSSESSRRFERGVDPNAVDVVMNRLTSLICELAGGTPTSDIVDVYPKKILPKSIFVSSSEIERILGVNISVAESSKLLTRIGFLCEKQEGGISVTVPTFRPDIERPIDVIEEIARLYGYGNIPGEMPCVRMTSVSRREALLEERFAREALSVCGFSETILYGFAAEETLRPFERYSGAPIKVSNPLSKEAEYMRTTLVPGLVDALKLNLSRQAKDVRLFAVQNVFSNCCKDLTKCQSSKVAAVLCGRRYPSHWERSSELVDFFDAKGAVQNLLSSLHVVEQAEFVQAEDFEFMHPGRTARILLGGKECGFVGELHPKVKALWDIDPDVYCFELDFGMLAKASSSKKYKFHEISKFPFVERDISIVVSSGITSAELLNSILDSSTDILAGAELFDLYSGKGIENGCKSVAISLRFALPDRTLTDEEVNTAQSQVMDVLTGKFGAKLRT